LIQCTQRESEVLVLLTHGLSNKTIAARLAISAHTVRDHICCLLQRNGLSNRVELAIFASGHPWQIGGESEQPPPPEHIQRRDGGAAIRSIGHPLYL